MIEFHLEGDGAQKPGVPVATFRTRDGFLTVNARRDQHFEGLCSLLGRPELAADDRFRSAEARSAHEELLMPTLRELIASRGMDELAAAQEHATRYFHKSVGPTITDLLTPIVPNIEPSIILILMGQYIHDCKTQSGHILLTHRG